MHPWAPPEQSSRKNKKLNHCSTESTKVSFGGYPRTVLRRFGRRRVLRAANTSILKQLPRTGAEFPKREKTQTTAPTNLLYPADLGALCASVVKSSSNRHRISRRDQTRTTALTNLLLPCRSWCSLCLRGEIFILRDLVARSSTAVRYAVCEA
jgi:hypothetical protein